MTTTIPDWNANGILPPIAVGASGNSYNRSPYAVTLIEFVDRFASSSERITILEGFLNFRSELHKNGLDSGFQWLDGSFLENIEVLENRPPNDLDVVTFSDKLTPQKQQTLIGSFNAEYLKEQCKVDACYFVYTGRANDDSSVRQITYWYSMWSHRRNSQWKGFLQVDLDSVSDAEAKRILTDKKGEYNDFNR